VVAAVVQFISGSGNPSNPPTPVPSVISTQVATLQNEVVQLRQDVDTLSNVITSTTSSNPDMAVLAVKIESLDKRLSGIEQAVLNNPAKALELTLLTRDMDNLKSTYQSDSERTRQEIERVYNQNNWFIGLMFTMALGLLSLAVSNFIKRPDKAGEIDEKKKASE